MTTDSTNHSPVGATATDWNTENDVAYRILRSPIRSVTGRDDVARQR